LYAIKATLAVRKSDMSEKRQAPSHGFPTRDLRLCNET
jgi:hypothetical protein